MVDETRVKKENKKRHLCGRIVHPKSSMDTNRNEHCFGTGGKIGYFKENSQ